MPDATNPGEVDQGEFANAWTRFVRVARRLLAGVPSERVLDPFMTLRDSALDAAESSRMARELQNAWLALHDPTATPDLAHLLLWEVQAFPEAVEIAEAEGKEGEKPLLNKKRLLRLGKTALDSVRDILDNLPPLAKGILTVLSEVFDIFLGD